MKKKILLIIMLSFLCETIASFSRSFHSELDSIFGFLLFFIVTYLLIVKYENKIAPARVLLFMFIGPLVVTLPITIFYFFGTLGSKLSEMMFWLGIILGYLFYKSNKVQQILIVLFSIILCGFIYLYGNDMWRALLKP